MLNIPRLLKLDSPILPAHQKIFDCLLNVNKERNLRATLRVAGGWVRDTMLGLHSNDVDIAIESSPDNPLSGESFAREVSLYQSQHGGRERTVSVIRVNPELSKHIETATVNVYDLPVEFCALRTDDYCDDSRIPVVRPASPMEDALRRDFTINALFYNLHTNMIEDYTGGLDDLYNKLIRCPLEPRQTFSDDPLRLLRGIRFAGQLSQLNFNLDASVVNCVDGSLLEILLHKVSRDRIGKEFTKMLSGPGPDKCVNFLFQMNILQRIILVEVYMKASGKKKQGKNPEIDRYDFLFEKIDQPSTELLIHLCRTVGPLFNNEFFHFSAEEKLITMLFILSVPFYRGLSSDDVKERVYALCVNGLKFPTHVSNAVGRLITSYNLLLTSNIKGQQLSNKVDDKTKLDILKALGPLNDSCVPSDSFRLVLLIYLLLEECHTIVAREDVSECTEMFSAPWETLKNNQALLTAYNHELPIKGNELMRDLTIEPKQIGTLLAAQREFIVLNPSITREDLFELLREKVSSSSFEHE